MLLSFFQRVENLGFFTSIRASAYLYPVILALHLSSIALFGGTILISNLRLLELTMRDWSVAEMIHRLRWLKRIGFVLAVTCGILLFCSKAEDYYH